MIGTDLRYAASLLTAGTPVAIPTETVYGLAANALQPEAVAEIFAIKNRPHFNPLIIHTHSVAGVEAWVEALPAEATRLFEAFSPGPLTLLLPRKALIPDLITAGSPRVAVRIPAHPLTLALLRMLPFPLAAPSANPFTYISPTTAQHVADQLGDRIPYILDGGPCAVGVESTIVGWEGDQPVLYRSGGVAAEAIEALLGRPLLTPAQAHKPATPGQLLSHYAPKAALYLGDVQELLPQHDPARTALLRFREPVPGIPADRQVILSPSGDLREAAQTLFAALRHLDSLPVNVILAEPVPDMGLGRAINDRLRRAQAERKSARQDFS